MTAAMGTAADRQSAVTDHFDRYAEGDRWGELYDPTNPVSHSFRARRDATMDLLGDLEGLDVLDLGCGSGALLAPLQHAPLRRYLGVDLAPNMIGAFRDHLDELGLDERFAARVGDVTAVDEPDASFDRIAGMGLIEYFDDPSAVVRESLRLLRPGGVMVFSIPHRACLNEWMVRLFAPARALGRAFTKEPRPDVKRDTYTPERFRALFEKLGAEVVDERYYNKLVLPYPLTRIAPGLAHGAARWAEPRSGWKIAATGYIAAARKPG